MSELASLLLSAQALGFIGARPIAEHLDQAEALSVCLGDDFSGVVVDLGSGGGVPGLPIAASHTLAEVFLVESMLKRADFLAMTIARLGLGDRVQVCPSPAEIVAHDARLRHKADFVCARGFGPPAMTAEIASGFLKPGGRLLVTTIADEFEQRWPVARLVEMGYSSVVLQPGPWPVIDCTLGASPIGDEIPRGRGLPRKKPFF